MNKLGIRSEELGKMRLSECRGQTCLNYAEHEHLRRSQLGVAIRDVSMYDVRWTMDDVRCIFPNYAL